MLFSGFGVFATEVLLKGQCILEYKGKQTTSEPVDVDDTYIYEFIYNGRKTW